MSADSDEQSIRAGRVQLDLSADELLILNNALNEVCNGVDIGDFEFAARIGGGREEARALLERLSAFYEARSRP